MWKRTVLVVACVFGAIGLTYLAFRPYEDDGRVEPIVIGASLARGESASTGTPVGGPGAPIASPAAEAAAPGAARAAVSEPAATAATASQALARGEELARSGRYADAVADLRTASAAGGSFRAQYLLGIALWKSGRMIEAGAALERAVAMRPDDHRANVNLARVYLAIEDPHSALAILEPEVVRSPGASDSWNVLGRTYFMLGKDEAAIEAYEQAVTLDADNAYAWNNLGFVYLTLGRYADALQPLAKAASLAPGLPYAQNNLGLALEKVGRLGEARDAFARAAAAGHGPATESLARVTAQLEAEAPALAAGDSTGLSAR